VNQTSYLLQRGPDSSVEPGHELGEARGADHNCTKYSHFDDDPNDNDAAGDEEQKHSPQVTSRRDAGPFELPDVPIPILNSQFPGFHRQLIGIGSRFRDPRRCIVLQKGKVMRARGS
jgi:hypothetical protein